MSRPESPQNSPIVADMEPGEYWWCACGRSKSQPMCDGSHRGSEFSPLRIVVEEARKVAWCACKRTGNRPYCDGSHARG